MLPGTNISMEAAIFVIVVPRLTDPKDVKIKILADLNFPKISLTRKCLFSEIIFNATDVADKTKMKSSELTFYS